MNKIDFDSVQDLLYPVVIVSPDTLSIKATDGTATICNLANNNQSPSVFILEPERNQSVLGNLNVRIAAIDPDLGGIINSVSYKIDSGNYTEVQMTPARAVDLVFPVNSAGGSHVLTVKVVDQNGGTGTDSVNYAFNNGQGVQVQLSSNNIFSGENYSVQIINGLPNTLFTVEKVSGPTNILPSAGTLNAAGSYNKTEIGSGLSAGNYTWKFKFNGGVERNVSLVVQAVKIPTISVDDYDIDQYQTISLTIDAYPNTQWFLGGTAGVTGTLVTNLSGKITKTITPISGGTITATNGQTILSLNINMNSAAGALLTLSPNPVNSGSNVTATISNSISGYVYSISYPGGSGNIAIGQGGSGSVVFNATNSGNVTATHASQILIKTLTVSNTNSATLIISPNPIDLGQSTTAIIQKATPNSTYNISGTSGNYSGKTIVIDDNGNGSVGLLPTNSGTVIATSQNSTLQQSVSINVNTKLSVTPNPVNKGSVVTVTITGGQIGATFNLSGTAGVTGNILIGANGSGQTLTTPLNNGTITATYSNSLLTTNITVNDLQYKPVLKIKKLNDANYVDSLSQVAMTETILLAVSGAKPNTQLDVAFINFTNTAIDANVWTRNIGGSIIWNYKDNDKTQISQPSGTIKANTDGNGNLLIRWISQTNWPFWDRDTNNVPPIDVDLKFKFSDNTETNVVTIRYARTPIIKAANVTKLNLDSVWDNTLVGASNSAYRVENSVYYSAVANVDYAQRIVYVGQGFDPLTKIEYALKNVDSFSPADFIPLPTFSESVKDQPITDTLTDGAGTFFYSVFYNWAEDSKTMYLRMKTGNKISNTITFVQSIYCTASIDASWLAAMPTTDVIYNKSDISQHFVVNSRVNYPEAWKPISIGLKKIINGTTNVRIYGFGGRVGDRVYYMLDNTGTWIDTGLSCIDLGNNVSGRVIDVSLSHNNKVSGQSFILSIKLGNNVSKNNITVTMTGSAQSINEPSINYPLRIGQGVPFNWDIAGGPNSGTWVARWLVNGIFQSNVGPNTLGVNGAASYSGTTLSIVGNNTFEFTFSNGATKTISTQVLNTSSPDTSSWAGANGNLRVNVSWAEDADIDPVVVDPQNLAYGYNASNYGSAVPKNYKSGNGGIWDVDDTGFGSRGDSPNQENIVWATTFPQGRYKVYLKNFDGVSATVTINILCLNTLYTLTARVSGPAGRAYPQHIEFTVNAQGFTSTPTWV